MKNHCKKNPCCCDPYHCTGSEEAAPQKTDIEALLDDVWNSAIEQAATLADSCVYLTPKPGKAIRNMLNGRAKLYRPPPDPSEARLGHDK